MGVLKTWWRATVSSTTPREEPKWPPVFETDSRISHLSSFESCFSSGMVRVEMVEVKSRDLILEAVRGRGWYFAERSWEGEDSDWVTLSRRGLLAGPE